MARTRGEYGRFCHCGEPVEALGLCNKHYQRNRRYESAKGKQRHQPPDFPGLGRIRCDACGMPLRDHPLIKPCKAAAIGQNQL